MIAILRSFTKGLKWSVCLDSLFCDIYTLFTPILSMESTNMVCIQWFWALFQYGPLLTTTILWVYPNQVALIWLYFQAYLQCGPVTICLPTILWVNPNTKITSTIVTTTNFRLRLYVYIYKCLYLFHLFTVFLCAR